jgi:hypothetical protein
MTKSVKNGYWERVRNSRVRNSRVRNLRNDEKSRIREEKSRIREEVEESEGWRNDRLNHDVRRLELWAQ